VCLVWSSKLESSSPRYKMTKTLAELEAFLDDAFSWRRAELVALEAEIARHYKNSPDSPLARALTRSGVALLYAHWEGYIKEACEAYLEYISVRRLRYQEICDELVITVLLGLLRRVDAGDAVAHESLLELVRRPDIARVRMPRRDSVVNTKSNLRYEVLAGLCSKLGLAQSEFVTRKSLINRSLCDARNEIAHGKLYFPDAGGFADLQKRVLEMLELMHSLLVSHARDSRYRVNAVDTGSTHEGEITVTGC
jgi:HEPN superfamily protein